MGNILIFETGFAGHHLEYLHHYYEYAINDKSNSYVFLIADSFKEVKEKYTWEKSANVRFEYIDPIILDKCINNKLLVGSFYKSIYLRKKCKEYNISLIITTMLMEYLPFLPFILNKKIEFRGIIYRIFLYEQREKFNSHKLISSIKYQLLKNSPQFKKIFILNDKYGTIRLNKKYNTHKFNFLPDPIPVIGNGENLKEKLNIPQNNIVFLHFGGLGYRKGTITILDLLEYLKSNNNFTFIFAGKIGDECKDEFYKKLKKSKDKCQILVYDYFCEYDFLSSLCITCDYILLPYTNVNQSSGVLGYAARFNKPVIGPAEGLLGYLIKNYKLGQTICNINPQKLAYSMANYNNISAIDGTPYIKENNIEEFKRILFS